MGYTESYDDDSVFRWEYTDQPHSERRLQIIRKYPEIKKYMKANGDPIMAVACFFVLSLHLFFAWLNTQIPLDNMMPLRFFLNIFIGSFTASWLLIHLHDVGHCLVFGPAHPALNRWYGLLVNLLLLSPMFSYFKRHHKRHHKFIGNPDFDAEFPTATEAHIFSKHTLLKYIWMCYNPYFQRLRSPFMGDGKQDWFTFEEMLNNFLFFGFSIFLFVNGCEYYWTYLALSSFVALGTNIFGIWAMVVHCLYFDKEGTISYYGWMNKFFLNFGYHVEHHDFPNVPTRFLPEIRRIAPEFYEDHHELDCIYSAILQWLHDPRLGVFSRVKRDDGGRLMETFKARNGDLKKTL